MAKHTQPSPLSQGRRGRLSWAVNAANSAEISLHSEAPYQPDKESQLLALAMRVGGGGSIKTSGRATSAGKSTFTRGFPLCVSMMVEDLQVGLLLLSMWHATAYTMGV